MAWWEWEIKLCPEQDDYYAQRWLPNVVYIIEATDVGTGTLEIRREGFTIESPNYVEWHEPESILLEYGVEQLAKRFGELVESFDPEAHEMERVL